MADQTINVLVEGGKATPAPPLGPALGPTGVNIGRVIGEINKETAKFSGMKVPVSIIIHTDKSFDLKVGIPTTSGLILKEAKLSKGGKGSTEEEPEDEFIGDISLEQVYNVAEIKREGSFASTTKNLVKEILGTMLSCRISCEGKDPRVVQKEIDEGVHDDFFKDKE
ncbi:MAG: 50S ribosomal protein L11 [Candidatus Heimdallarchaeota archaeon]|nr:50S ribosomal protein L11 [Candidatus Heimdallarchaeota archaeon]